MQYGHVHTCAMIKKTKNHQNSSKVKCMSSAKYDEIYCIVIFFFTHVLLIMIKTDLIEIKYYLQHKSTTFFLTCQSIGVMNPLFKYYLIHLNILITFPESSQWTPPFSPFLFSKFSFLTIILPKHFDHFPNKRDIVSRPLPLFSLCIERSPNACIYNYYGNLLCLHHVI